MKNEDQEWLDALSGKVNGGPQTASQIEAGAVRRVLTARRESIEKDALNFDPQKLEPIKLKLLKEGFLQDKSFRSSNSLVVLVQGLISINSGTAVVKKIGIIAAILFVGFALRVTYFGPKNDDAMLFRGDANVTYIIDEKFERKLNELVAGLTTIQAEFTQEKESYGKTLLKIKSSDAVLAYLAEKRIEPKVVNGYISIVLTPPKVQSK
jgi:hypothetical protein